MNEDSSSKNLIRELLAKKSAEFKNVTWTIEKAKSVFQGRHSPISFNVWREAGLYLAKHDNSGLALYARKTLVSR